LVKDELKGRIKIDSEKIKSMMLKNIKEKDVAKKLQ